MNDGADGKKARILAVANQKGGVGKTTTSVTLAAAFARLGKKVLLVDVDPHGCASVHLRVYPDMQSHSIYDVFIAEPEDWAMVWNAVRIPLEQQQFSLVPANTRLSELEIDLRERPGKGAIIKNALAGIAAEYDYVLLDCPPHVSVVLVNALVAADLLIIPIQTDFLALYGLKLLFDTVNLLNKVLPEPIRYKALATMFDRRTRASMRALDMMDSKMGDALFRTVISVDTLFREASAQGRVIYDIDPDSRGGKEYEAVAREIINNE